MALIGIGKCSKYYIYIFVVIFCQFICDYLTQFNKDNEYEYKNNNIKKENNIIDYSFKLENHFLIRDLLKFIGEIICGIILYIFYKHLEQNTRISLKKYEEAKSKYFGEKAKSNNNSLYLIGFLYSLNIILRSFCMSLNFDAGFWTLEIIFIVYLSYRILKTKIGNHQKVTIFLLSVLFIFQILSTFIQRTNHECKQIGENCKEIYLYDNNLYIVIIKKLGHFIFIPILFIIYIINYIFRDYSWVKSKYLMDIKSVPMYKILFFTGITGTIIVIICFSFVSFFPCNSYKNVDITNFTYIDSDNQVKNIVLSTQICNLMDYDDKTKELKFYYDNFLIFLKEYNNFNIKGLLEIVALPLYLIMNLIISFSQIMILKHLDIFILLVNVSFNYFIGRLIVFIINKGEEKYMTLSLFILLELEEIISIIAYSIYMELIELKFCKLDYDLKKNIQNRGNSDFGGLFLDKDNEEKEDLEKEECNQSL